MSWWNAFTGKNSALNLKPTNPQLKLLQPASENAKTSVIENLAKSPVFTGNTNMKPNAFANKKNLPGNTRMGDAANAPRNNAPFTPLGNNLNTSMNKYMSNAVRGGKSRKKNKKSKKSKKHTRRA